MSARRPSWSFSRRRGAISTDPAAMRRNDPSTASTAASGVSSSSTSLSERKSVTRARCRPERRFDRPRSGPPLPRELPSAGGLKAEGSQDARATRVRRRRLPPPPAGHHRAMLGGLGTRRASGPTRSRPCGRERRRRSSPVCSRDLLDERPQTIVPASETELVRALAQLHMRRDDGNLFPRDPHDPAAADPGCEASGEPRAPTPRTRSAEDRDHLQLFAGTAVESEIVDVAAPPVLRVQQLAIDELQTEDDRLAQFWPALVRMSSGTAVNATTMITTR